MNYAADTKLPLYNNNCDEKTKEVSTKWVYIFTIESTESVEYSLLANTI